MTTQVDTWLLRAGGAHSLLRNDIGGDGARALAAGLAACPNMLSLE
jgi:hypothetical protein